MEVELKSRSLICNSLFDSVHQGRTKLVGSCTEDYRRIITS